MPELMLTNGNKSTVDEDVFLLMNGYTWREDHNGYVVRNEYSNILKTKSGKKALQTIYISREIMNCPSGMLVDHVNGNKLDNRRRNLRVVTVHQNNMNRSISKNNKSGFKGVSFYEKRVRPWRATIKVNKKKLHIGFYETPEDAALAYDIEAKKYFCEYARLNFPN